MTGRSGLSSAPALQLRPATPHDADRLLAWRNRPEIVALGTLLRTVDPAEHAAWFAETLASDRRLLLLVLVDGEPAGQVRFDVLTDAAGAACSVSIYLLEQFTGRSLGPEALRQACAIAEGRGYEEIWAFIREENTRSITAFRQAGFTVAEDPWVDVPTGHRALRREVAVRA